MRSTLLPWSGAAVAVTLIAACAAPADKPPPPRPPAASAAMGDAPADVAPLVVTEASFVTPSGNIGCRLTAELARCDIKQKSWSPPPNPADCELASGFSVTVPGTAEAGFGCAGDSLLGAGETLGYGHAVQAGDIRCVSEPTAIRCENTVAGHGFKLARERYDLW